MGRRGHRTTAARFADASVIVISPVRFSFWPRSNNFTRCVV